MFLQKLLTFFIVMLFSASSFAVQIGSKINPAQKEQIEKSIAKISVPFIENRGQVNKQVGFYARTFGGTLFVTKKGELVYSLPKKEGKNSYKLAIVKEIIGKIKSVEGEGKSPTRVNIFKGKDRSNWKRNLPTYKMVNLGEAYKGIEVKLKAYGTNIEKLFYIKPNANPKEIKVRLALQR